MFYVNPPTGSQTVAVSGGTGAGTDGEGYLWAAYDGFASSGQPDSAGNAQAFPTTALNISTTVVAANCWVIGLWAAQNEALFTSVTNGTSRIATNVSGFSGYGIFDSNGVVGAGLNTLTVNTTNQFIAGNVTSFILESSGHNLTLLGVGT